MSWLRKLVAPELVELLLPHWLKKAGPPLNRASSYQISRARRRRVEAAKLRAMTHLYPPQQGSRRPEWSSAVPGRWSTLNGAPAELPTNQLETPIA